MRLLPIYALRKLLRRGNALAIFSHSHDVKLRNSTIMQFLAERLRSDITENVSLFVMPKRRKLVLVTFTL